MSSAEKYVPHYTRVDYSEWIGDWELWRGIPVSMSPAARPRHQEVGGNLFFMLKKALLEARSCERCKVLYETDWVVSDDTVVRPDVLITCEPLPDTQIETRPEFVAEVLSPGTAEKDRTAKLALYGTEGVRYYAILDPDARTAEFFRLAGSGYERLDGMRHCLELAAGCSIEIDLAAALTP